MELTLIRSLYDYHRWANHRLFEVALGLGDAVTREMGKHWSVPTVKGMFAHLFLTPTYPFWDVDLFSSMHVRFRT